MAFPFNNHVSCLKPRELITSLEGEKNNSSQQNCPAKAIYFAFNIYSERLKYPCRLAKLALSMKRPSPNATWATWRPLALLPWMADLYKCLIYALQVSQN